MASGAERFVEQVTKLPVGAKAAIALGIAAAITGGNWYFMVSDTQEQTTKALKQMASLEKEMFEDQAIASNLAEYRKVKELLEQKLQKALTELPVEANVPDLIEKFYENGEKAGLVINSLEPKKESKAQFYAEIPFGMAVSGNYHEIATYFDALRHLKRIVNVSDVHLTNPRTKNEKVIVDATFSATTFRFLPTAKPGADKGKK